MHDYIKFSIYHKRDQNVNFLYLHKGAVSLIRLPKDSMMWQLIMPENQKVYLLLTTQKNMTMFIEFRIYIVTPNRREPRYKFFGVDSMRTDLIHLS